MRPQDCPSFEKCDAPLCPLDALEILAEKVPHVQKVIDERKDALKGA